MVSASKPAMAPPAAPDAARAVRPVANVGARISAYLIDSVILLAVILVFFVLGGAVLLFTGDFGEGDPPDSAYYACLAIFLGGTLISWSALNLWLLRWRGQTAGMYVIAIRTIGEDAPKLTTGQTLRRWFGLHPLLFHPFLLPVWAVFSLLIVSITLSQIVLVVTLALVILCVVAPLASLIALIADPERRALHDRLARTLVVHIDQP